MSKFTVVPQIIKVKGVEIPVLCKQVKFAPQKDANTGEVIGFIPLKLLILKIVLQHEKGGQHYVTWNGKAKSYVWHWPGKTDYPVLRDLDRRKVKDGKGRDVKDTMAQPVEHPGETRSFSTDEEFYGFAVKMCGKETADEIVELFIAKMLEIAQSRKAA